MPLLYPVAVRVARQAPLSLPVTQDLAIRDSVPADPTRVCLVAALAAQERRVCDLASVLGLRQATVSQQLRLLRTLRVVRFRKEGRTAFYRLDDAHVADLLAQGLAHIREAGARHGGDTATG